MTPAGDDQAWVSVIIPVRNEEQALPHVLKELPRGRVDEIIVVDNGSIDGSAGVARAWGARVVAQPTGGYGAAMQRGLQAVQQFQGGKQIIVFLDGDHSDYPQELEQLVDPIVQEEADFVVGSRLLPPGGPKALPVQSRWGNCLACWLIHCLWGFRYTDLGPFRAIRFEALERLGMRDSNFGWTVEMQIKAILKGLRIQEVPVRYRSRIGKSKITGTVSGVLRAGSKILYTIAYYAWTERKR